jgi:hypothetical protein
MDTPKASKTSPLENLLRPAPWSNGYNYPTFPTENVPVPPRNAR